MILIDISQDTLKTLIVLWILFGLYSTVTVVPILASLRVERTNLALSNLSWFILALRGFLILLCLVSVCDIMLITYGDVYSKTSTNKEVLC